MCHFPDVDTLSVTPPLTVASLWFRIANAEGVMKSKIQILKDTDGEALMNANDLLSLLAQTYQGCTEDDPQVGENYMFSKQTRATLT